MSAEMRLRIPQLIKEAPQLIAARASVELIGPPGCGKTELVEQITEIMAERTGTPWGFSSLNCSTALPITVPGFPLFSQKNERGTRTTEHTEPVWMTCRDGKSVHEYDSGILLLDERRSADGDIKKQLADLILNGRSGNHVLPKGWVVWSTGNRTSDRSGATKDFDFIINRHLEVHLQQNIDDIADRYATTGVHPAVIAFCMQNPQIILHETVPETQGPWATPRSMVLADNLLRQYANPQNPDHIMFTPVVMALVAGQIGDGAAHQLGAFLKMANSAIKFSDIVADPMGTPLPEKPDMSMLICYSAAARCDMSNISNVVKYVSRLPDEFAVMFVRAAVKKDMKFINTKAITDWTAKNSTLMSAMFALA